MDKRKYEYYKEDFLLVLRAVVTLILVMLLVALIGKHIMEGFLPGWVMLLSSAAGLLLFWWLLEPESFSGWAEFIRCAAKKETCRFSSKKPDYEAVLTEKEKEGCYLDFTVKKEGDENWAD